MKHKEIIIGQEYILHSSKNSRPACSSEWFDVLIGQKIMVIDKYNNHSNKNVVKIEAVYKDKHIEMWCSPFDLRTVK